MIVDHRHALYVGWLLGIAMRQGLDVRPVGDDDGNYTDRLTMPIGPDGSTTIDLIVPPPSPDWSLDREAAT